MLSSALTVKGEVIQSLGCGPPVGHRTYSFMLISINKSVHEHRRVTPPPPPVLGVCVLLCVRHCPTRPSAPSSVRAHLQEWCGLLTYLL